MALIVLVARSCVEHFALASVYTHVNPSSSMSMIALQRTRSWRIDLPAAPRRKASDGVLGLLMVTAITLFFYLMFS